MPSVFSRIEKCILLHILIHYCTKLLIIFKDQWWELILEMICQCSSQLIWHYLSNQALTQICSHFSECIIFFWKLYSICRCIKPNGNKAANCFDPKLVMNQLHSTGVMETTRIRRLGYSTRLTFQEFLERWVFWADMSSSQCLKWIIYVDS